MLFILVYIHRNSKQGSIETPQRSQQQGGGSAA